MYNKTQKIATSSQQNVQPAATQPLQKFTPDEIFQKIDQLRSGFEPPPTLLEQLLSAGKRDYARSIEEAKISAIKARKDLIDGLGTCVKIYVDAHAGDLKVRVTGFITETLDRLKLTLAVVNEDVIGGYYDTWKKVICEIKLRNLSPDMEKKAIYNATERLNRREISSDESVQQICDALTQEIMRFTQEVGR